VCYSYPAPPSTPLSHREWFVVLMLLCFFPYGLYLVWTFPGWNTRRREIVTAVCVFI
jgi:hypothetical protein